MARGVPASVAVEPRVPDVAPGAKYVVVVIEHRNAALPGHGAQQVEHAAARGLHLPGRQNDEGGAIAVRALLEQVEPEGREIEQVFLDARRVAPQKYRAARGFPLR